MEYFRLNLYRQGKARVQKGVFGLKPEVAAAAPAVLMGFLLLIFAVQVYLPKRSTLQAQRREIEVVQKQIDSLIEASRITRPVEKQYLELRQERIGLTPYLQDIAETVPQRVWLSGLAWKPPPVSGRQPRSNDPFSFRLNEITIKGRAYSRMGQAPLGLVNQFINSLADENRLGVNYSVELGRTFETRELLPQPRTMTSAAGSPAPKAPEYRSVLDFTLHCRVIEAKR